MRPDGPGVVPSTDIPGGCSESAVPADGSPRREEMLVVVRGSDIYGGALLRETLRHTVEPLAGVAPGAAEALAAGLRPLRNPQAFDAEVLTHAGVRAVLFKLRGTAILLCTWPANKPHETLHRDQLAFERILANVLTRLRPKVVHTSDPSPGIVGEGTGVLRRAFASHVDTLVCAGTVVEPCSGLLRPSAHTRRVLEQIERASIDRRLAAGRRLTRGRAACTVDRTADDVASRRAWPHEGAQRIGGRP